MKQTCLRGLAVLVTISLCLVALMPRAARAQETGNEARWYFSPSLGIIDFEGDQEFEDSITLTLRLGYEFSERWTFEGDFSAAPYVEPNGATWSETYVVGLGADAIFHFTRWERVDPFLAAGFGVLHYGEDPAKGSQNNAVLRAGGGVMYHINDEWAVRADYRAMLAGFGDNPNANAVISGGMIWTWGARVLPNYRAAGAGTDSDRDGLDDATEAELGTDPYNPDSDGDRLSDGDEVNRYRTDPLNEDSDWDGLTDGDEILTHRTDPLKRDTDAGGVADGHEIIEDSTNPLDPSDDLQLYELYIQFEYDKTDISRDFRPSLDIIAKVLRRHPNAEARVEGHADRTKKSGEVYNKRLSQRRAEAVAAYLATTSGIDAARLTAVGYGFSRPKAPNDVISGNPLNRRVEIYISGLDEGAEEAEEVVPTKGSPAATPAADK